MNLKIELDARQDKDNNIYYLGKLTGPLEIDCNKGVALLVFISENGTEELQIANLDPDSSLSHFYHKENKIKIKLDKREDANKKIFYVAKLKFNGTIDCYKGASFMIFNSKENKEEIQIDAEITKEKFKKAIKSTPEIIYHEKG